MLRCSNCGSYVSRDYARVFTPDDIERPRACPYCVDRVRDGGEIREARAPRRVPGDD